MRAPGPVTAPSAVARVAPRNRGSQVGFVIDHVRDRQIRFESGLEARQISRLSTDPETRSLREQVRHVYQDADGRSCRYTADLVRERDHATDVVEVKYEKDVGPSGVEDKLRRCAAAAAKAGDRRSSIRMVVLDERSVDAVTVSNADLVRRFLGDRDHRAVAVVREWLAREAPERFPLRAVRDAGLGFRGMRAVASLLATGEVTPAGHGKLGADTILVNRLFNRQ